MATSLLILLDDIASVLDDVATTVKVERSITTGYRHPCRTSLMRRLVILFLATLPACLAARADDAAAARQSRADAVVAAPIHGICGDARAADAVARGANAVRTYSIPTRDALDRLHAAGLRVIPGVWMPHEGANKAKEGGTWNFSYAASGPKMLADFAATLDRLGDHPAILMWTLGNEVHVSPEYLQQVERMSRLVHERFPRVLTSLTIVNAPPDTVRLVREHAPDIDVLGVNAYGQGAIANATRFLEEHWDGLFYFSEFNATGPWWGPQASWGPRFEPSAPQKVDELRKAWAHMRASPRCAGGCLFQWGRWGAERITYFSSLLPADPFAAKAPEADLRFTPVADEIARLWAGKPPRRLAPVLERIAIGAESRKDITVEPGGKIRVSAVAVDADTPAEKLRYRWWIAREHGGFRPLAGPVESAAPDAELTAPADRDAAFFLVAVVLDDGDGICGTTLPFRTAK
jgi:hypothetical protein